MSEGQVGGIFGNPRPVPQHPTPADLTELGCDTVDVNLVGPLGETAEEQIRPQRPCLSRNPRRVPNFRPLLPLDSLLQTHTSKPNLKTQQSLKLSLRILRGLGLRLLRVKLLHLHGWVRGACHRGDSHRLGCNSETCGRRLCVPGGGSILQREGGCGRRRRRRHRLLHLCCCCCLGDENRRHDRRGVGFSQWCSGGLLRVCVCMW
mmetsp:Transcript_52604/g.102889  ORF Transcript_52604/g.102889 Transcript_52604/m.102889 type:complete len:205 (+) Transcript_52604:528-1142(+)